jgi:hypothetical protein
LGIDCGTLAAGGRLAIVVVVTGTVVVGVGATVVVGAAMVVVVVGFAVVDETGFVDDAGRDVVATWGCRAAVCGAVTRVR